ncbi:MAG: VOC family protein, partial [Immundisolibacteraceae bacterium]|nr:VOC family protein [Immundisolibacteraceae bacterium]
HRIITVADDRDDICLIGWEVLNDKVLETMVERLTAAGVEVSRGSEQQCAAKQVSGLVQFVEPNGIASEIYYGPVVRPEITFNSPRGISGFNAGLQGMGHFVLAVDDYDTTYNFYREVLGMGLSDYLDFEMMPGFRAFVAFLHCNPREHTLAFAQAPAPKRLLHFMVEASSLDEVGTTYDLCQDKQIPISMTLGRHTNDYMLSFYAKTPSGFDVEFGAGARTVDPETWTVQRHNSVSIWGHRPPA